jgi:hypothetical protein
VVPRLSHLKGTPKEPTDQIGQLMLDLSPTSQFGYPKESLYSHLLNIGDESLTLRVEDVRRELKNAGLNWSTQNGDRVSQVDRAIGDIQHNKYVDYVGPLAGYKSGIHTIYGKRILVQDSPRLLTPEIGAYPMLDGILNRMLGQQRVYLEGWLSVAVKSLYSGQFRVGQALVLAGPGNSGKSLLQYLITYLLGGRTGSPYHYMSGGEFNGELFGYEHLKIEDRIVSTSINKRLEFGASIKEIAANIDKRVHAKNKQALTLTPFWRLTISVNDEPEQLLILPPIDEHIADKLIILKAAKHPMPMPTRTAEERKAFQDTLMAELPFYLFDLLNGEIAAEYASERYGITHYHNQEIMQILSELAPDEQLLELLYAPEITGFRGSARELKQKLCNHHLVGKEATRLLDWHANCGTYLARLARKQPKHFTSRHSRQGTVWSIDLPD